MALPRLIVDVETQSTVDLRKAGAHAYAEHPDTDIIVLCWMLVLEDGTRTPVQTWLPGDPLDDALHIHVRHRLPVIAHNYLFEWNIWNEVLAPRYGWPALALEQMSCTMARALYHGLPAGLDALGEALELAHKKDKTARDLMLRMARPRAVRAGVPTWWRDCPKTGAGKLQALSDYCARDVLAEADADRLLPELPAVEQRVFQMDGRMNQRGLCMDLHLVSRLLTIIDEEGVRLDSAMSKATRRAVIRVSKIRDLMAWLKDNGTPATSLDKVGLPDAIKRANPVTLPALLIRREGAKASTAKLRAIALSVSRDGRARGLFQFGGAGRTMRWAGRRIQTQNIPRPTLRQHEVDQAVSYVREGGDVEGLDMLWPGTPMDAVASMLRACITARAGYLLVSADFAQIEARVIAWLAGQTDLLAVFASGGDPYTFTAKKVGSSSRMLGKVLVLACGFGMGWPKFQATALTYGLVLDDDAALGAVTSWRRANPSIVRFWYALSDAFIRVALSPSGAAERLGVLVIRKTKQAVRIVLPSGHHEIIYQQVRIQDGEHGRPEITFKGVDQKTGRWSHQRTYGGKLAENITQAVARDIMAEAKLAIENAGEDLVGSIHDEALAEAEASRAPQALAGILDIMRRPPAWAAGLPVGAEGWVGPCYRKG